MIHACARQDCEVLTMGRFCLEHEQDEHPSERSRTARVAAGLALLAAGVVGAALRARLGR